MNSISIPKKKWNLGSGSTLVVEEKNSCFDFGFDSGN
jgi:hypothetical protein